MLKLTYYIRLMIRIYLKALLSYNRFMAKERLSKLQKWILIQAYNENDRHYAVSQIYWNFFGIDKGKFMKQMKMENEELWKDQPFNNDIYSERKNLVESVNEKMAYLRRQKAPIVSKSLKRLREKGLITQPSYKSYHSKSVWHKWRVELTAKGISKAEEILKQEPALLL